jgi:hypothetical protein
VDSLGPVGVVLHGAFDGARAVRDHGRAAQVVGQDVVYAGARLNWARWTESTGERSRREVEWGHVKTNPLHSVVCTSDVTASEMIPAAC